MPGLKVGGAPPGVGPGRAGPAAAPAAHAAAPAAPATGAGTGNVAIGRSPFASLPELPVAPTMLESIGLGAGAGLDPLNQSNYQSQLAMNQFATQDAQLKTDDALLQRLAPAIRANKALVNSPAFMQHIMPILLRRGEKVPLGPDGKPDPDALAAMIATAPPMTITGENAIATDVRDITDKMGAGGAPPNLVLPRLLSDRQRLMASGMDTSSVDVFLNSDHTGLRPDLMQNYIGAKSSADIDHLQKMGVHMENQDAFRRIFGYAHEADVREQMGFRARALTDQERKTSAQIVKWTSDAQTAATRAQTAIGQLQVAQGRLAVSQGQLGVSRERLSLDASTKQTSSFGRLYSNAHSMLSTAEQQLSGLEGHMNQMANLPGFMEPENDPKTGQPVDNTWTQANPQLAQQFRSMANQAAQLRGSLEGSTDPKTGGHLPGMREQLGQIQSSAIQAGATNYTNMTGNPAYTQQFSKGTSVPGGDGNFLGKSIVKDGKKFELFKDNTGTVRGFPIQQ